MTRDYVELRYETWGSLGQYRKTLAVLVDGTVLDPERLTRYTRRGQGFSTAPSSGSMP